MTDQDKIIDLLENALSAAESVGMEFVAESEGCTWSGKSLEEVQQEALKAKKALIEALGLWSAYYR